MSATGDVPDLDLALSSLNADSGDTQLMFRLLVERLSDVLGNRLRIDRGGRFKKNGPIQRVEIEIGGNQLIAELGGGAPQFQIGRISGGIRIRTDQTDVNGWLTVLLDALNKEAEHSTLARHALETIIIGGG